MKRRPQPTPPDEAAVRFYRRSLRLLNQSGVPYLVGGAFALARYTGVARHTKDLDIHVLPEDRDRILAVLAADGFTTEVPFPHWLAKAYEADNFIDVIYNGGNGLTCIDAGWFEHSAPGEVLDVPVRFCPAEEMLWSKAFVMERERFDGADVIHLIRARGRKLDWDRLIRRFGPHAPVLLSHLTLFRYAYPGERDAVPDAVFDRLLALSGLQPGDTEEDRLCRGTLLSREQYLVAVDDWGYRDARVQPAGPLTEEELAPWQAAIGEEK